MVYKNNPSKIPSRELNEHQILSPAKITTEVKADNRQIETAEPKNLKLKIDGFLMYGFYSSSQIDRVYKELKKPQDKRLYILGIDFSRVKSVEVIK